MTQDVGLALRRIDFPERRHAMSTSRAGAFIAPQQACAAPASATEFSLLGGPLHRLGGRLGLVRRGTNSIPLGLALGASAWAVLVGLAFAEGVQSQIFSLSVIGGHVRLLVVIPLFFVCEALVDPGMAVFVRTIVRSGIVTDADLPAFEAAVADAARFRDSWLAELLFLGMAALVPLAAPQLLAEGASAMHAPGRALGEMPGAVLWYWIVCLTLFRFLVLRWLWRIALWCYFLRRVARLKLNLVPTHPDGVAGLGYLEVVQAGFAPLVAAISALASASAAESIVAGTATLKALSPAFALLLVVEAVMFLGPVCVFVPRLWRCRVTGLATYMDLASRYVREFDRKWLGSSPVSGESLLGSPDLQSLADLSNSVRLVTDMRLVPVSRRLLVTFMIAALVPLLPLLLLTYPVADLAAALFKMIFSM